MNSKQFMKWTFKEKEKVGQVLDVTEQAMIDVINFAFDNGADYYCMAEPSSGPALMNPMTWKTFVQPLIADIVDKVKGPLVLHIGANTDKIVPMMCETGVPGIVIDKKADLKKSIEAAHEKGVRVFGNVSAATSLFMGTPEDCYKEAISCLENGIDFLTPDSGIAPQSPLQNVLQLKRARNDFFR